MTEELHRENFERFEDKNQSARQQIMTMNETLESIKEREEECDGTFLVNRMIQNICNVFS